MLAFLWLRPQGATPEASAQAAVESACDNLATEKEYDFTASLKGTNNGVSFPYAVTQKGNVSGEDYYTVFTVSNGETDEFMRVGGDSYWRRSEAGNVWERMDIDLKHTAGNLSALGNTPICPDLSEVVQKGETELDGVKVIRYISGDIDGSAKEALEQTGNDTRIDKEILFHEYLVDANGQLVQHRLETFVLTQLEDSTGSLHRQTATGTSITRFYDVGEPNTITAPAVGE